MPAESLHSRVRTKRSRLPARLHSLRCLETRGLSRSASRRTVDDRGAGFQFPWESHPQLEHNHTLEVGPFFIDKYPVTGLRYEAFLNATSYVPADSHNFLKNWNGGRLAPEALRQAPVTYVSLEEARAFCRWAGGRLPHAYEWQYAAQGLDGRPYPWGNKPDPSRYPSLHSGTQLAAPIPVGSFSPQGDSPFGVADLVGTVWQWTDEFFDEHTRQALLRGGSNYRPSGSDWYYPQAVELDTFNKYLLMAASFDRTGTIGFRCVSDSAQ